MQVIRNEDRGHAEHGWLSTKYSFSFSDYFNPSRMGFGKLRVLNDDIIAPGKGFPDHPHRDMEIITVVTKGELRHQDNTGGYSIVKPGMAQVMSAGSGIVHSEFNNSLEEPLELFQMWILTDTLNANPRHEEKSFEFKDNEFTIIAGRGGIPIHQNAFVKLGDFTGEYKVFVQKGRGVHMIVVEGKVHIEEITLNRRDAVESLETFSFKPVDKAKILLIDVPMD